MFKKLIQLQLEKFVIKYFKAHPDVRLIVVVGSVGKTSTKSALARVLGRTMRVRMHPGNHNTDISAPLAMLGVDYPKSLRSISEWQRVFREVRARVEQSADVDVVIQELGVDRPGDMKRFIRYVQPELAIVTAITPEHMANFTDLGQVAREELMISQVSKSVVVNANDTDQEYFKFIDPGTKVLTYGFNTEDDYRYDIEGSAPESGYTGTVVTKGSGVVAPMNLRVVGRHSTLPILGAVAASHVLGVSIEGAIAGVSDMSQVPGRMNILKGIQGSTIIDDTYNSSPAALKGALEALFAMSGSQRVAILGSMNELGETSRQEHEAVGRLCVPASLDILITVGEEANSYLAPAAKDSGCVVYQAWNALEAGELARSLMIPGAVILAKGSEGGIFVEEAVKYLLDNKSDEASLVRQSAEWMNRKRKYFEGSKKGD